MTDEVKKAVKNLTNYYNIKENTDFLKLVLQTLYKTGEASGMKQIQELEKKYGY